MANNAIRLSPSGPVIVNEDGGQLVPGSGMVIRMNEVKATCGGVLNTTPAELGSGNLRAELPLPNPAYKYKAAVQINSWQQVSESATLRVQLQRATNEAEDDWEDLAFDLFEAGASAVYHMAVANQQMAPGDGAAWDITAGVPKLVVRAMVSVTGDPAPTGTMPNFQGFISLVELF